MADEIQSYEEIQQADGIILPWQAGPNGRAFAASLGILKDGLVDAATDAARARTISLCPFDDALAAHGEALGWEQAPGETTPEYRARLLRSWHLAQWRGTVKGIVDAFGFLGMPNVEVREAVDNNWRGWQATEKRRWFSVILRQPHPFGTDFSFRYGDGTVYGPIPAGSGKQWGVNGDPRLIELLRRLIRRQKPAHARCADLIIVLAGDVVDLTASATDGTPANPASRIAYVSI